MVLIEKRRDVMMVGFDMPIVHFPNHQEPHVGSELIQEWQDASEAGVYPSLHFNEQVMFRQVEVGEVRTLPEVNPVRFVLVGNPKTLECQGDCQLPRRPEPYAQMLTVDVPAMPRGSPEHWISLMAHIGMSATDGRPPFWSELGTPSGFSTPSEGNSVAFQNACCTASSVAEQVPRALKAFARLVSSNNGSLDVNGDTFAQCRVDGSVRAGFRAVEAKSTLESARTDVVGSVAEIAMSVWHDINHYTPNGTLDEG